MNQNLLYCNTVDDMLALSRMPLSVYPTVASAVRNISLPLNKSDHDWITGNDVQVFQATEKPRNMSFSNMSGPTFTPDDPIIVTGVSVMVYPEPMSFVVEGNAFSSNGPLEPGTKSPLNWIPGVDDTGDNEVLGWDPTKITQVSMAHLEHGGPTWRFMIALMHAFQLQFNCPQTAFSQLINEKLIDIGNACARMEFKGLSDAQIGVTKTVRAYNRKVRGFEPPTGEAQPGFFLPVNCEIDRDGESKETVAYRTPPVSVAYGQPNGLPAFETWYRLPFPMPIDHNTKISMFLRRSAGDEVYQERMRNEGLLLQHASPIAGSRSVEAGLNALFTQIPHGMIRIGLGLKGFQVRESVCHSWRKALHSGKTLADRLLTSGTATEGALSVMNGPAHQKCITGLGAPGSDNAAKVIDAVLANQNVGPVGDE